MEPKATMEIRDTLRIIDLLIQALPDDLHGCTLHCDDDPILAGIQAYIAARWPEEEGFYPDEDFEE